MSTTANAEKKLPLGQSPTRVIARDNAMVNALVTEYLTPVDPGARGALILKAIKEGKIKRSLVEQLGVPPIVEGEPHSLTPTLAYEDWLYCLSYLEPNKVLALYRPVVHRTGPLLRSKVLACI